MVDLTELEQEFVNLNSLEPPSKLLLLAEFRAVYEVVAGMLTLSTLSHIAPKGNGQPVLVLPGLGGTDSSTSLVRSFLNSQGFSAYAWEQGRNVGPTDQLIDSLRDLLLKIVLEQDAPVTIVGWSLGGLYARELAKLDPKLTEQVITMGTPFACYPSATNASRVFEHLSGTKIENDPALYQELANCPPVPCTSIFSKLDGVVSWKGSIQEDNEFSQNIEVVGLSHMGMGFSPLTLYLLAKLLNKEVGVWEKFQPSGWETYMYQNYVKAKE